MDVSILNRRYTEWTKEVGEFLKKNVRESTAVQFGNVEGDAFMGCPEGRQIGGCGIWQNIEAKRRHRCPAISRDTVPFARV